MATIASLPARKFGAANPVLVVVNSNGVENNVTLTYNANARTEYTRSFLSGSARFNFSPIAMANFREYENGTGNVTEDQNLAVHINLFLNGNPAYTGLQINAVSQRQGPFDMTSYEGKILTEFKTLYTYDTYPMAIGMLELPNAGSTVFIDGSEVWQAARIATAIGNLNLAKISNYRNQAGTLFTAKSSVQFRNGSSIVTDSRPVTNICIPDNPVWIRWLNRLGGYDYWMFSIRQVFSTQLTKVETYIPETYQYTPGPPSSYIPLSGEAKEELTVGADMVSEEDYNVLRLIAYSPRIQLYNAKTSEWERVFIDKVTFNKDTRAKNYLLEVTLTLPIVNLQF